MKRTYTKRKKLPTSFTLEPQALKALNKMAKILKISKSQLVSKIIMQACKA